MTDTAKTQPAPGGPAGAVDEFAHIPRSRARHPIVAAGGGAAARFSSCFTSATTSVRAVVRQPPELGAARVAFAPGRRPPATSRIATCASPGRPTARARSSWTPRGPGSFRQLFRVLGTGDRLFVHRRENPLPAAHAEADVFEGRLIRVATCRSPHAIRAYFAKHVTRDPLLRARRRSLARAGRAPAGGAAVAGRSRRRRGVAAPRTNRSRSRSSKPDQVRWAAARRAS